MILKKMYVEEKKNKAEKLLNLIKQKIFFIHMFQKLPSVSHFKF